MRKPVVVLLAFFVFHGVALSQSSDLFINRSEKGFFIEHKTEAKENFFSIGRLFSVHPRHIAAFNSLDMNKGLSLGQVIRIPLSDTNFSQQVNKGAPVFYTTKSDETITKIAANNKVPIENLKKWNQLTDENIGGTTKLIVGFLVAGEFAAKNEIIIKEDEPVLVKTEEKKDDPKPVVNKEIVKPIENVTKEEPKKTEPAFVQVKEEKKSASTDEGYFKNDFEQQIKIEHLSKELTVTSGIFKTVSGWQDHKYYMLIDKVVPGTIVKVINPANNKSIYVKVLYGMEGIRQNEGYDIRISNAAAYALDISDTEKFIVTVKY